MKKAKITLLSMIWVTGLMLAGSEVQTITGQFISSMTGLIMFAASSYFLADALRGE